MRTPPDPEIRTLKRIARLLEPFDVKTRRRMLGWLAWKKGELSTGLGRYINDEITNAPPSENR